MNKATELHGNQTLETIQQRRSVRLFTDQPVPEMDLLTMLSAANKAPSAHNQQSWRFVVLRGEKKAELANLVNTCAAKFHSCGVVHIETEPAAAGHAVVDAVLGLDLAAGEEFDGGAEGVADRETEIGPQRPLGQIRRPFRLRRTGGPKSKLPEHGSCPRSPDTRPRP